MSELPVGTPKGKTKTNYIHQGRISFDSSSCSSTITTVDAKDLIPNHLTPLKGSYRDICKYGCKRDPKSRSWCPDGKGELLKLDRSPRVTKLPLDSNTKRTSQVKRHNQIKPGVLQIKPEPWRIPGSSSPTSQQSRRLSEIIIPDKCQYIEKDSPSNERSRITNVGVKRAGQGRKKEQWAPVVSRAEKSTSNKPVKKQNTAAKATTDKYIEEHVPEKILHVIETKAESKGNEATCTGSTFPEFSSSNEGTLKNESINETRDSGNSPTNKPVKKQNSTAKATTDKYIEEHVPDKILHAIEPKAESKGNEAIQGTTYTGSTFPEFSSSNEGFLKNEAINETRDSDNSPTKGNFRKGKTNEVQQEDTNTRRLKFRQPISLNTNLTVKSPRKTEMVNPEDAPPKCIMVKLRSQNFEEKQRSHQSSYNSLIEDTANRLVKAKKGTVMALVKAFETVISIENSQTFK